MPYENPYIQKVADHPRIWEEDEVFAYKGKWKDFFGNDNPLHLEIGTGLGNFLSKYAQTHTDTNLVGMEIKYKRLHRTMEKCEKIGRGDVVLLKEYGEKIPEIFEEGEIDEAFLLFPDPWPKKRHWKNRILQDAFLESLHKVLKTGGVFHFKTDDASYFDWGVEKFTDSDLFSIELCDRDHQADKVHSQENSTEFEQIWRSEGRRVHYLKVQSI